VGYEVSLVPWLVSVLFKKALGLDNLEIHKKSCLLADLSVADAFVCVFRTDWWFLQIPDRSLSTV